MNFFQVQVQVQVQFQVIWTNDGYLTASWFNAINVGYELQHGQHRSRPIELYERER